MPKTSPMTIKEFYELMIEMLEVRSATRNRTPEQQRELLALAEAGAAFERVMFPHVKVPDIHFSDDQIKH